MKIGWIVLIYIINVSHSKILVNVVSGLQNTKIIQATFKKESIFKAFSFALLHGYYLLHPSWS